MKKNTFTLPLLTLSFSFLALLFSACNNKSDNNRIVVETDAPVQLKTLNDSLSWALGFTLAQNMAATGVDVNREILFQSICTTLDSKQQPLSREATVKLLNDLEQMAFTNRMQTHNAKQAEVNIREEQYFSDLTKNNPNVKKSDKGFYYEILKEGNGMKGELGKIVVFDYKGSFTNGQIFDQTYGNRQPITHVISESMFPGLLEGLCMMRGGSTYRFYFPSELGFGAKGTEVIPPYTTIIYEVEVHDIHD